MSPDLPEHLRRDWDRYRAWMRQCAAGDCRYAGLSASEAGPPLDFPDEEARPRCTGYRASLTLEHRDYVLRSGLCARQRAWWQIRRAWLQAKQVRDREALKAPTAPKAGWRTDPGQEG